MREEVERELIFVKAYKTGVSNYNVILTNELKELYITRSSIFTNYQNNIVIPKLNKDGYSYDFYFLGLPFTYDYVGTGYKIDELLLMEWITDESINSYLAVTNIKNAPLNKIKAINKEIKDILRDREKRRKLAAKLAKKK